MPAEIKIIDGKKPCAGCKKLLPISCFTKHAKMFCGLDTYCKECKKKQREANIENRRASARNSYHKHKVKYLQGKREYRLAFLYDLSLAEYDQMFKEQDGNCKICGLPEINRRLSVDHCHKTGKIRSLLCGRCNVVLGRVEENTETLWNMIEYIMEHEVSLERK